MTAVTLGIALMLATQAPVPAQVGFYVPNSQLLTWCKSKDPGDFQLCWSFIDGVVEAAGMTDTKWPKGAIALPDGILGPKLVSTVVQHIERLAPEKMSSPAVRSIYDSVVAVYPYTPPTSEAPKN